ncbi:hypothetical protein AKJ09_00164 [Labilithrix luteola]|uniref:PatA-like N-terminal domain-containing protein n=1 Tax=Labilithrix luteola TaxID=1391654 RepID=A0A0K1PJ01_9BACT|nr:hypothetical protein AKJ09_00164 [Labilithrix luteola]
MIFDHRPLETLTELASGHASGELICASSSVEVHVYFQNGRVAWATDSGHPLAFTKKLLEGARVDIDVFREILESCRREKRPLGETLITWGVANREEVRAALKHQIDLATTALLNAGPVQTLFLNRSSQFAAYDSSLTFSLEELTGGPRVEAPSVVTSVHERMDRPGLATRLQALVGADWIEVLDGNAVVESLPLPSSASRVSTMLFDATLGDGAELVAIRTGEGTLGGAALAEARSIWCRTSPETTIGALVAGLTSIANDAPPASREVALDPGELWTTASSEEIELLRSFAARIPELRAAFVTDAVAMDHVYGVGRPSISAARTSSLVVARMRALLTAFDAQAARTSPDAARSPRRMMTQEPDFLVFAEELVIEHIHRVVWILLDRSSSKGLGWGHASALGRRLLDSWASRRI